MTDEPKDQDELTDEDSGALEPTDQPIEDQDEDADAEAAPEG